MADCPFHATKDLVDTSTDSNAETARAGALDKALSEVQQRFDAGIASRLDVLDIERNRLAAELARIDSERASKTALASIFKAMGGA